MPLSSVVGQTKAIDVRQLDLFGFAPDDPAPAAAAVAAPPEAAPPEEEEEAEEAVDVLRQMLSDINPDELTPRMALDALYALREVLVRETVEIG